MIFEICADSYQAVVLAKKYKVKRIELCSALSLGGLTPSLGLIEKCLAFPEVEIHVMVRPKEGGFVYNADDIEVMENDIISSAEVGAKGVVFGCLTKDNEIDIKQNKLLYKLATSLGLEVTFHRAFDYCNDPIKSLEELVSIGFDRVLSSGQATIAEEGIPVLTTMHTESKGRIEIMAGGGVNTSNVLDIAKSGVDALHFTIHHKTSVDQNLGMGSSSEMNEQKLKSIIDLFT